MNKIEQLESNWPDYKFIADSSMPIGLPALNVNDKVYWNPNVPFNTIWTIIAEEIGHGETTSCHDITRQLTPQEWKEERTARDFGLEIAIPFNTFRRTLTSYYDNDWEAANDLEIDLNTLHARKELYDKRGI
ncbi:hypothetical protein EQG49_02540 [Periweissella cryptocerci]|uniref:ImmA/IrrE family metallo-endopeptidase n=1 Tax=Periweissella cryptocerci TaxID=2506420 RepID=A0A4P6YRZ3_9LACO|nr:hypothetical protein [Periweissella cryptocerci]QBO35421.1 hypothetical protein EQG49_02540 [Periweissella cryptocerci]